jgi:integrase
MTAVRGRAEEYLATRRALRYKLETSGRVLMDFVGYLEQTGTSTVTTEAALAWAVSVTGRPEWQAERLGIVRRFAVYLHAIDADCEVPPQGMLTARRRRHDPFVFSDADVGALMDAARALTSPLTAATYETLIGLLATTGLRIGEAIRLDDGDVAWPQAVLTIRNTKFNKSRLVPLHPSTVDALKAYCRVRDGRFPKPKTPALFVSSIGRRMYDGAVLAQWHLLVADAGIGRDSLRPPTPHALRHRFAVATLIGWYRDGADVEARLPLLSTYLGHVNPASTYWYLRAAPELLALAAERLEMAQAGQR